MKRIIPATIIALASIWLGWTVLVDFFIVPTVFQEINNFFEAGFLGIAVFSKLNSLELIVGTALVGLTSLNFKQGRNAVIIFVLSLILWLISMLYFTYLTPELIGITELWHKADLAGVAGLAGIPDLQQEHQHYHRIYIIIDSFKLFFLASILSIGIFEGGRWK